MSKQFTGKENLRLYTAGLSLSSKSQALSISIKEQHATSVPTLTKRWLQCTLGNM